MKVNLTRDEYAYIATLGLAPQVVSIGYIKIREKYPNDAIKRVYIIHPDSSNSGVFSSIQRVREFLTNFNIPFDFVPIKLVKDISHPHEVERAFKIIFKVIKKAKEGGYSIHLNIAGGRKTMSVLAVVAAQLLFDINDRAWHIISTEDIIESGSMTPEPNDSRISLVPIPIIPWSDVDPVMTIITESENPLVDERLYVELKRRKEKKNFERFVLYKLTKEECRVLREIILTGGPVRKIAQKLGKSPRTVDNQIQSIYRKFKEEFGIKPSEKLRREILVRYLGPIVLELEGR